MFENLTIHFMTWCCHIIPVFKGQCLFAGTPLPLSHAIPESYGYLPFPGTQLSEMRELRGFGQEKSDMCGLFVNVRELSVVSLLKGGACTQALLVPEFTLNETNWCLPPRLPIPSSSQPGIFGFKWDCSGFHVNKRLCTKLTI